MTTKPLEKINVIPQDEAPGTAVGRHDPDSQMSGAVAIIQMIERAARDPAVDIDKMRDLMTMRKEMLADEAKRAYDNALSAMQPELPVINRRGKIEVRAKTGTGNREGEIQQSTRYALWEDINEEIKPVLGKHGFALSFRVGLAQDGKITVTGILSHREGHREETTMTLPHDSTGSKNAVQAVGSSTSYGKRYTAQALLNLTSRGEDDDGKGAVAGPATINADQGSELIALIHDVGGNRHKELEASLLKYFSFERLADIPATEFARAKAAINRKRAR